MRSECDRTRLIAELASLLRDCELPDEARHAGLTLIGWLARRMPGEGPSTVGVEHASEQCSGDGVAPASNGHAAGRARLHGCDGAVVAQVRTALFAVRKTR